MAGRVTGVGGVFFKAKDAGGYHHFDWREYDDPECVVMTAWSTFPE